MMLVLKLLSSVVVRGFVNRVVVLSMWSFWSGFVEFVVEVVLLEFI